MRTRSLLASAGVLLFPLACSNSSGVSALLKLSSESAGENCEVGGTRVDAGQDTNENGQLDADEISETTYLCEGGGAAGTDGSDGTNGTDGADGTNGTNGTDGDDGDDGSDGDDGAPGVSVAIRVTTEAAGANCEFGGTRVETGPDANTDGTPDSVTDTAFVCASAPAASPVAGFRLVSKFTAPGGPIAEIVSVSPDGNTLVYTSSATQTIGFADITNPAAPTLLGTLNLGATTSGSDAEPTSLAFAPDGEHVVVVVKDTGNPLAADPGALVVVRASDRTIVGQVALGVGPDSVALTPDGTKAIVAIEDEENEGGNNAPQARTGSLQIVTLDYATPANSTIVTIPFEPTIGNMPSDVQPEYVDVSKDGSTAIVSLQENNLIAVVDLTTNEVTRYIDAGVSEHARADLLNDRRWNFTQTFRGQAQPDGTCFLPDGVHFLTANEGDTSNNVFPLGSPAFAGGRGFSIYSTASGERVYDSGDAAEWAAFRAGAYPDARSANRGVEPEGCGVGTFGGSPFAFVTGERNSSVFVLDVSRPASPVIRQILGGPNRPESATAIESRGLFVVGGEGNGTTAGGGIWIYEAVSDVAEIGHGAHVYDARTSGTHSFGALSALAYEPSTGHLLAVPDNAYAEPRIWSFAVNHSARRVDLVDELLLRNAAGEPLAGIDPEGLVVNPEGGFIVATEGVAGNGATSACTGGTTSNRLLFFTNLGQLDPSVNATGIVDLPCGAETNAFDWTTMTSNGFEGVTVVDSLPGDVGGLKVYAAFQRPLTGESSARIGEYDVDTATWNFYYYPLDADVGGVSGNTFLSELIHVGGDKFAVIERDQGISFGALNKTIRTFELSSGSPNSPANPLEKTTAIDLFADSFRFDQEKIEGLALGGGSLFVVNDNDGGQALNFFVRFSPQLLGGAGAGASPEILPNVVLSEVNSTVSPADYVELQNVGATPANLSGFTLTDGGGGVFTIPDGTIVAPGAYLLLNTLGFGLGSNDSVVLASPLGTPLDSFAWTSHVGTASRCGETGLLFWPTTGTNGSGAPSPGTANDCTGPTVAGQSDVVVNEINSSGNDFVELFNSGASAVDLTNWKITDNDPTHVFVIPPGTVIAPGGHLVIEGDSTPTPPALDFGLGQGDTVNLYSPYDQLVDTHTWVGHAATASRCPDGTGAFVNPATASKGAANICL